MKPKRAIGKAELGFGLAAVMPEQFEEAWHGRQTPPEAALQLAMLEQAVMDLRRPKHDRESERVNREALLWVASDDKSWPFSFLNVCANFDLEPGKIRACLIDVSEDAGSAATSAGEPTVAAVGARLFQNQSADWR